MTVEFDLWHWEIIGKLYKTVAWPVINVWWKHKYLCHDPENNISEILSITSASNIFSYYEGDEIKKDEMGGTCGMHGEKRNAHVEFWWWNLKGRNHLQDLAMDGSMLLKWIFREM